ncbi:MAG TPA: arylsulfatase [Acidobacteriota bacterium]|nr:arylsulfatase [Acidobacteriota bacterium]
MNLRTFICAFFLLCFGSGCTNPTEETLPNVVIIYADDMGYGDLSIQNAESRIPTPNLDQLAKQGIRFTDGHSSSGICSPSRYALLTGRYHWRKMHGIVQSFGPPVIDEARLTMPEMLQRKGYRTACIGKWHLGWNWNFQSEPTGEGTQFGRDVKYYKSDEIDWETPITGGPLSHGFDYYFGDDVPNFPPYTFIENDRVLEIPYTDIDIREQIPEGSWEARLGPMVEGWKFKEVMPAITAKAVEWIHQQKTKEGPFFLYFPLTAPHAPIIPSDAFIGKSQAGPYGDYVFQCDWSAGQVLEALEENGFSDNTIVIFTSDNGPERYAYDRILNFEHRSMGPLRGLKRDIWEGGHRVPFIIRWPDVVEPGRISNETISQIDLMATIAAVIGYELPSEAAEDSYNLLPLLKADPKAINIREATVQNTQKDKYAIRKANWLLIDAPSGGVSRIPEWFDEKYNYEENSLPGELYDLSQDISQQHNLFGQYPEKITELRTLLKRYQTLGRSVAR